MSTDAGGGGGVCSIADTGSCVMFSLRVVLWCRTVLFVDEDDVKSSGLTYNGMWCVCVHACVHT